MRHRVRLLGLLLVLCGSASAEAATVTKIYGTITTLISTATAVTSNSGATSGEVAWATTGYPHADCELVVPTWSGTVAAGTGVTVWLLIKPDGTNYEDGSATVFPARLPDMVFPLRNVNAAQRISLKNLPIPVGPVTAIVKNDGTGVTMQGTWTLKCRPWTWQVQ